jgi:hypothetical protein
LLPENPLKMLADRMMPRYLSFRCIPFDPTLSAKH